MTGGSGSPLGFHVSRQGPVALIELDRQEVLNALDSTTRRELAGAFRQLAADQDIGAVVLTGAGDRAFTVGQDLRESETLDTEVGRLWMETWVALYEAISALPVASVAILNGVAAGAGLQLGLLCDVRVAASSARLGLREIDVGLPAITGFWLYATMVGRSRAIESILTGRLVSAIEAQDMGLVDRVVAPEDARSVGLELAAQLAGRPRSWTRGMKAYLAEASRAAREDACAAAARDQVAALASGVPQALMGRFLGRRTHTVTAEG
jgi:enoyl-CoA hydratase/carnithine racemase